MSTAGANRRVFPASIDPVQPMMDLRALTHEAAPGLTVTCRMEGDTYEMEDQRNWTDASYKTYVRPLALPWPYTLAARDGDRAGGDARSQRRACLRRGAGGAGHRACPRRGRRAPCPRSALGLDPDESPARHWRGPDALRAVGAAHLVVPLTIPAAATTGRRSDGTLGVASAIGAEPWLEAVIAGVEGFEAEIGGARPHRGGRWARRSRPCWSRRRRT